MNKHVLRTMVRGTYDLQKLRIQFGNRITGNFKAKLGQEPGEKEDTLEAEDVNMLRDLRARYARITDAIATKAKHRKGAPPPTRAMAMKHFEGDEVISHYSEWCMIGQYLSLIEHEETHFKHVGQILGEFPIWVDFLEGVKGIGPAMGGVIISEIDIEKAKYPSSLWAYAGLDVVGGWELEDTRFINGDRGTAEAWVAKEGNIPGRRPLVGEIDPSRVSLSEDGPSLSVVHAKPSFSVLAVYQWVCKGGRGRRKEHLREVEYTDKDGKPATRVGITFNPFLKTKLMGVLAASFLKIGVDRSPYARIYYDYKHRMEQHVMWGVQNDKIKNNDGHIITSKGKRHNMAMRYMVKQFLIDLYKAWRTIENLPVSLPYHEAKLGLRHAS